MPTVWPGPLRDAVANVFQTLGAPVTESALVADHLVDAELAGVTSHGIIRFPQYVERIEAGKIVPNARLTVIKETVSTAVLDGNHGFGQVMVRKAMDRAIQTADRTGISAVTVVNCSHTGRLGSYTEYAARQGRIGLIMANAGGHGQWVAPFGGLAGRLGTNPLSVAVPSGGELPLVLDFATSVAPEGKVRARRAAGKPVPEGWVIGADGHPTTDPAELYGPPRGALLPFGGHKGFGLSLIVDALAGGLSGAGCCFDPAAPMKGDTDGVFLIAIDVEAFAPALVFQRQIEQLIRHVKACPLAPGFESILVPGELEHKEKARREREGIPVEGGVWRMVQGVFKRFSVVLDVD